MNNYFNDKVALVTGASSGMGLATALAFAQAGASVTLADVKEEAVQKAAEKLVSEGHRAIAIPCDVSNDAQVEAMVERTVAQFGRLDAAFNNAGVMAKNSPTADSTLEEFDRVTRVNLQGVWSCMKHELRQMDRQGSGAIVNCSSIGGVRGDRGIQSYTASKHGVIGLTRAAALEYAAQGIRVNAVCPGTIDTAFARTALKDAEEFEAFSKALPHWPDRQARGDRVGGALAVQPGSKLRRWARTGGRRWANGTR